METSFPIYTRRLGELASGRISTASNPAGLSISQVLQSQIRGIAQARENLQVGVSYAQTAEGALGSVQDDLQRMRELSGQANNSALSDDEREAINTELQSLQADIDHTITQTSFNSQTPLTATEPVEILAGPNSSEVVSISAQGPAIQSTLSDLDVALAAFNTAPTEENAAALTSQIDETMASISAARSEFGAAENRFGSTIRSLDEAGINAAAADSRIADADVASATLQLTFMKIIRSSDAALFAQANINQQLALRLLV